MRQYLSDEVFTPGAFPEHTYVSRTPSNLPYTYEFRLKQALSITGYLTSIIGPSKTGKTVLCEKVVGQSRIVDLSGNDFRNADSFWGPIATKIGLSLEGELTRTQTLEADRMEGVVESQASSSREKYLMGKDRIIEHFKQHKKVLVLDDFHYAPVEIQFDMAYQLKDVIRKGFKAIVISLPHRADDAIRKNPDLSGRLSMINIESWQMDELKEIAIGGFDKLDVKISDAIATDLAKESLTSPQLMQAICLNLALLMELDENDEVHEITEPSQLIDAYKVTTLNLDYRDVVRKLKAGPSTRGQNRKKYELADGSQVDIYELLLKVIAMNPPIISISLDELKRRIDQLLGEISGKPDRNKIRSTIEQVQSIIDVSEPSYHVFEWKDDEVYILDPLFLFYLRWGAH